MCLETPKHWHTHNKTTFNQGLPGLCLRSHYNDVIMGAMASQTTSLTIVNSTVYSGADQSSASLAFVRGIHRWPMNSPHKGPVMRIFFLHLMRSSCCFNNTLHSQTIIRELGLRSSPVTGTLHIILLINAARLRKHYRKIYNINRT